MSFCLPCPFTDGATIPQEAAAHTRSVSDQIVLGLLFWRLKVTIRINSSFLDKQGHVSGDATYAS